MFVFSLRLKEKEVILEGNVTGLDFIWWIWEVWLEPGRWAGAQGGEPWCAEGI